MNVLEKYVPSIPTDAYHAWTNVLFATMMAAYALICLMAMTAVTLYGHPNQFGYCDGWTLGWTSIAVIAALWFAANCFQSASVASANEAMAKQNKETDLK